MASIVACETAISASGNVGRDFSKWLSALSARFRSLFDRSLENVSSVHLNSVGVGNEPRLLDPALAKSCHKHP